MGTNDFEGLDASTGSLSPGMVGAGRRTRRMRRRRMKGRNNTNKSKNNSMKRRRRRGGKGIRGTRSH